MKTNKNINHKLNPTNLDEIIGFDFLFPSNSIINKMINNNKIYSLLFFGPPGCGKSLSLKLILKKMNKLFHYYNASINNKNDLINILSNIDDKKEEILLIEEIHRLNKDKQDILLSFLENNKIILLATTTENPFFVINPAIRSRMYLYEMKKIPNEILIDDLYKYLTSKNINISLFLLEVIVYKSNFDFRQIFMYIDIIETLYKESTEKEILDNIFNHYNSFIDKKGTNFYNILSALHKSIRGSDPDASLYYLAQLLESDNLLPIYRRLYAIAYEDISLANSKIGPKVHAAIEAAKCLGMPEARIPLSSIVVEMALSPKSNSTINAIDNAIKFLESNRYEPPNHIKDSHYNSSYKLGVIGYKYPHNYKNNWVKQEYFPNEIKKAKFYNINNYSYFETKIDKYWNNIKKEENNE